MTQKIIALVDCNNFYASCERVFDGNLENKPVAVLSNNDGCIIARSNEVKALGIPMGAPLFKYKELIEREGVYVFSANFPLYGDMSHRVMKSLASLVPEVEVYSIDEAFLDLTNLKVKNLTEFCKDLRQKIKQWTGIPVSVGVGPTKTLAKAANKLAKKDPGFAGVFNWFDHADPDAYLDQLPVGDLWGVGRQYTKFLNRMNINTAKDLKYADSTFIKKKMTVMGEKTLLELNGTACIPISMQPKPKKVIACTRSYGHPQKEYKEISESVSYFTRKIGEKLRVQNSVAQYLQIFILTNLHRPDQPQYHNSIIVRLEKPSDFTPYLIQAALAGLKQIYKQGYSYKKAGVIALGLQPRDLIQYDCFEPDIEARRAAEQKLMGAVDNINKKVGADVLKYAAEGVQRGWWMNQTRKSRRYTTKWSELLEAKLKDKQKK